MDKDQEEMKFLGLFGVFNESFKILFSWWKIFTKITLALILPLSFIFLTYIEVSSILLWKILHNTEEINETQRGTPRYEKLSDMISSEWATFCLSKIVYFTLFLIFSLLSTSAVVYTIASIYTAKEITFGKVMTVVPKVWKRLMVTFLCTFAAFFAYNVVTAVLAVIMWALVTIWVRNGGVAIFVIIGILYLVGFVYLTLVWQLANVVTVLEDSYGVQAMKKSKELIKGKMGLSILIFLVHNVCFLLIWVLFKVVVHGWRLGSVETTADGVLYLLLSSVSSLFGLVLHTVLYFVCKSYHHENIDKLALSDHLEVYLLGEYVPLKAKDVHMEQYMHV